MRKEIDDDGFVHRNYEIKCKKCGKKIHLDPIEPYCHCGAVICPMCLRADECHTEIYASGEVTLYSVVCVCEYEICDYER